MNSTRTAGTPQGLVLSVLPIFAMLGAVLMAPLLATMQAHFADVPHADVLVPLLLTTPSLCLALLAPVAGMIADRFGSRSLLLWSLVLYALAGTAPMYLESLYSILASRLLVGVAEAGLVTACTALLSHYFSGDDRHKWFAYQNAVLPFLGAFVIAASGAVGNFNWRVTFAAYALSLIMWVLARHYLFEVRSESTHSTPFRFPPRSVLWRIVAIAVPGSIAFYIAPVELAYLLQSHGFTAPSTSGVVTAMGILISPLGALTSRRFTDISVGVVLAIAMAAMGIGLIIMAAGRNVPTIAVGMILQQLGGAAMLTTGLSYTFSLAKVEERGMYAGSWWFFYMLAQFATPLLMSALLALTGNRATSVIVAGALIAATCVWLLLARALRRAVVLADPAASGH